MQRTAKTQQAAALLNFFLHGPGYDAAGYLTGLNAASPQNLNCVYSLDVLPHYVVGPNLLLDAPRHFGGYPFTQPPI